MTLQANSSASTGDEPLTYVILSSPTRSSDCHIYCMAHGDTPQGSAIPQVANSEKAFKHQTKHRKVSSIV